MMSKAHKNESKLCSKCQEQKDLEEMKVVELPKHEAE